jgi:hypothetical protein
MSKSKFNAPIKQLKKDELMSLCTCQKAFISKLRNRNNYLTSEVRYLYRQLDYIYSHIGKVIDSAKEDVKKEMQNANSKPTHK